jgi:hypothetical protein
MSYWPRLVLTDEEKEWCVKYYDPDNPKPFVKRRFYPGFLQLTEQKRNPIQSFNIARRTRVFGLDFAGSGGAWIVDGRWHFECNGRALVHQQHGE